MLWGFSISFFLVSLNRIGGFLMLGVILTCVMYIYEIVFDSSNGLDHTVVTADDEDDAEAHWDEYSDEGDELVEIESHGEFRNHDSFEEIRVEIQNRGVPDEYQN